MEYESELPGSSLFNIFDHIDQVLVDNETRDVWTTKEPKVWPSAASVELYDQTVHKIAGKCMRSVFLGMVGNTPTRKTSPEGFWKMVIGKLLEKEMTGYARQATKDVTGPDGVVTKGISLHVASGVRIAVPEVLLSFEVDLIALDPKTFQGVIVEQKTFSTKNYAKFKEVVKEGKPSMDNLIQLCIYLLEIRTGANLKILIRNGLIARKEEEAKYDATLARGGKPFPKRNRIEITQVNLDAMDDGPLAAKLAYLDRSDGFRKEMNISIEEDPLDELTYPVVDGQVWKFFPLESIYARYKELQEYFYAARRVAEKQLYERGIEPPLELQDDATWEQKNKYYKADKEYYDQVGKEMRSLPPRFWPPAEYEFDYSAEKIELMWTKGLVAKTRYEGWKKKHKGKERIGDWQCRFCDHGLTCMKVEKPELAYLLADLTDSEEEGS